jgi:hypothetical protein
VGCEGESAHGGLRQDNAFLLDLKSDNILLTVEDIDSVVERYLAESPPEEIDAADETNGSSSVVKRYKSQPLPLSRLTDTSTIEIRIADFGTGETSREQKHYLFRSIEKDLTVISASQRIGLTIISSR